jgi:hypothetical protein
MACTKTGCPDRALRLVFPFVTINVHNTTFACLVHLSDALLGHEKTMVFTFLSRVFEPEHKSVFTNV